MIRGHNFISYSRYPCLADLVIRVGSAMACLRMTTRECIRVAPWGFCLFVFCLHIIWEWRSGVNMYLAQSPKSHSLQSGSTNQRFKFYILGYFSRVCGVNWFTKIHIHDGWWEIKLGFWYIRLIRSILRSTASSPHFLKESCAFYIRSL